MAQLLRPQNDLHGAAAQNEAGTHQYGVADLFGGGNAFLYVGHRAALGLRDVELQQKFFETVAVFRQVDGFTIGADDLYPAVHEGLCQVDGGLTA